MARKPNGSRTDLEERLRREQEAFDQQMAALRAKRDAKLRELNDELARVAARERQEERKRKQRMAFVLGEFLLREGPEAEIVQTIVGSPAFEQFTRSPRNRGARPAFGLPEIVEPKPSAA